MRKFPCPTCEGTGKVDRNLPFKQKAKICLDCKGAGEAPLNCNPNVSLGLIMGEAESHFSTWMQEMEPFLFGRSGIVFLAFNIKTGKFAYTVLGDLHPGNVAEKLFFATEKMRRLVAFRLVSSFEDENIFAGQFGGAIRLGDIILSASGFPPHMDQNFCLNVAQRAKVCDAYSASMIYDLTEEKIKYWSRKVADENKNK